MKSKKKTLYLTSAELAEALEDSQRVGKPTEQVCRYFQMIAQHLLGDSRYRNYSQQMHEDMASAALFKCIKNIKNYKKEYADKCFNYFTRCTEQAFWEVLSSHYKYMNIIRDLSLDFADNIEQVNQAIANKIRDAQIEVNYTKEKTKRGSI